MYAKKIVWKRFMNGTGLMKNLPFFRNLSLSGSLMGIIVPI